MALAIVIQPWTFAIDLQVGRPAAEMGRFFGDSFQRRTGRPLSIVAGDPSTAALVSLTAPSRPSLYLESAPEYLPRVTLQDVAEKGAVVIWPAIDTAGQPPPDIKRQFPDLVPEACRSSAFQGRMPLIRMGRHGRRCASGWAAVNPPRRTPQQRACLAAEPQQPLRRSAQPAPAVEFRRA